MTSNVIALALAVALAGGPEATPQRVSDAPVVPRGAPTDEIPVGPTGASVLSFPLVASLQQSEEERAKALQRELEKTKTTDKKDDTLLILLGSAGVVGLAILLGLALSQGNGTP